MSTLEVLREVVRELREIKERLQRRPRLEVPPLWVRQAALSFHGFKYWTDAYKILCDYYGIPELASLVSPTEVPKDAVACYLRYPPRVVSQRGGLPRDTAIHEFFHHLAAEAGCRYDAGPSEAMTRAYVRAFFEGLP
jgi:hypothetical protein